ncbi:MAG TPA: hypothetical protein VF250_16420 [Conexibacter sp.]
MLTVVKIGGGLARDCGSDALRALCAAIGTAAGSHPLLVVPGGGGFADAVRVEDRHFGLRASTSHRMAALAMDQLGLLLGDLIPRAALCRGLDTVTALTDEGRAAVLLPAALVLATTELPESWDVTSDSIATWVAGRAGARRVVLLKSVGGLYRHRPGDGEPIRQLSPAGLAALQRSGQAAGVDSHFAAAVGAARVDAWVIGGDDPARLLELLDTGETTGTHLPVTARHVSPASSHSSRDV